jgi:hypothetical protein
MPGSIADIIIAGGAEAVSLATALNATDDHIDMATLAGFPPLQEFTVLPSAARTATVSSATFTNPNARGMYLVLNVTVASGTGGLQVKWTLLDPVSGAASSISAAPTAIIATGVSKYLLYPGAVSLNANMNQLVALNLPRTWRADVIAGDASSYTYSLGGIYLP